MRLVKIGFKGFRRLANTACNVDGKLIAFLAANELGKTTLIQALNWLWGSAEPRNPLVRSARTRGQDVPDDQDVVWARYVLDDEDRAALKELHVDRYPDTFTLFRKANGTLFFGSSPSVSWNAKSFGWVGNAIRDVESDLAESGFALNSVAEHVQTSIATVCDAVVNGLDRAWSQTEKDALTTLAVLFDDLPRNLLGEDNARIQALNNAEFAERCGEISSTLQGVLELVSRGTPDRAVRFALRDRCPHFALFSGADRDLRTSYDLADETVAGSPPAALENLLRLGGSSVAQLREVLLSEDITHIHNTESQINKALRAELRPSWSQSTLTVKVALVETTVRVLIEELHEGGATTAIEERSAGLRAFIALVCFLQTRDDRVPPVLLIEHPENDLHPNAQADLVNVLQRQEVARQVIYTTHGVDCLPPDVGTGLRFVVASKNSPNVSELKNGFWHNGAAGYDDLQVLAGAERAAFTKCSRAVVAEGATELLLLPTLIKLATGEQELQYRVSGGLATTHADSPKLRDIAIRTAYLVDGDDGGRKKRKELIDHHIPEKAVFTLPRGKAIEDLLTLECYLAAVNAHLAEAHPNLRRQVTAADLPNSKTRGYALKLWCKAQGIEPPGKTVIANRLIRELDKIELEEEAVVALKDLHARFEGIFNASPEGAADSEGTSTRTGS